MCGGQDRVHVKVIKMLVGDQNGTNTVERSLGLGPRPRIDDNCPIAIVNAHARMSELGDDLRHSVTNRNDPRQARSIKIGSGLTSLQQSISASPQSSHARHEGEPEARIMTRFAGRFRSVRAL
jgi:hypothetical protein